jgi:hypothetical protein
MYVFHDVDPLPSRQIVEDHQRCSFLRDKFPRLTPSGSSLVAVVLMEKTWFVSKRLLNKYWGRFRRRERLHRVGCSIEHRGGAPEAFGSLNVGSFPDGRPARDHLKTGLVRQTCGLIKMFKGYALKQQLGDVWIRDGLQFKRSAAASIAKSRCFE